MKTKEEVFFMGVDEKYRASTRGPKIFETVFLV
jgi:hypothetical protein